MSQPLSPAGSSISDFVMDVIDDPVLVQHLLGIDDRKLFLDEVLRLALEGGYTLTAEDFEPVMAANRRRWIERSLPW